MILRACNECGKPSPGTYCEEHKRLPWATSQRKQRVGLSGSAEQARARRILARDQGICHVCGNPGADQADHLQPLAEGGADDEANMAAIHRDPCHGDKTAAEAARGRRGGGEGPLNRLRGRGRRGASGARRSSLLGEL